MLAAGGAIALLALATLTAAAVIALGDDIGYGSSALLVGLVLAVIATVAIVWGKKRMEGTSLKPEKTIQSIEEGKQWMRDLT